MFEHVYADQCFLRFWASGGDRHLLSRPPPRPSAPESSQVPGGHGDSAPGHLRGQVSVGQVIAFDRGALLSHGLALRGLKEFGFTGTYESKIQAPVNRLQGADVGPAQHMACRARGLPHSQADLPTTPPPPPLSPSPACRKADSSSKSRAVTMTSR